MENEKISREKHADLAIGLVGGPTVVIDYGGLRLVTDPTFSAPGQFGALTKQEGPAVPAVELGPADVVLLSHDEHLDNFDPAGREYAASAGSVIVGPGAAARLGHNAVGLEVWQDTELARSDGGAVRVEVVPALHGPRDGERDDTGHVNCEVVGFVLSGEALPTIYVSGDNASIEVVAEVAEHHPEIDLAVLFTGAARVSGKQDGRPLTLTAERAADAALLLGVERVVPAHFRGWRHFSEGAPELAKAFADAGIVDRLHVPEPGVWLAL